MYLPPIILSTLVYHFVDGFAYPETTDWQLKYFKDKIQKDLTNPYNRSIELENEIQSSDEVLRRNIQPKCRKWCFFIPITEKSNRKSIHPPLWSTLNTIKLTNIAIIVPYQNSMVQLTFFLTYISKFLEIQGVDYTIYVVQQSSEGTLKRGMLMNAGFKEVYKYHECFIFHDIDFLPMNTDNQYECADDPKQLSRKIDAEKYRINSLFGGVLAIRTEDFIKINGFSNLFNDWGDANDNIYYRIKEKGLNICRVPEKIGVYFLLNDHRPQASWTMEGTTYWRLWKQQLESDGLNNLEYQIRSRDVDLKAVWLVFGLPNLIEKKYDLDIPSWEEYFENLRIGI